MYSGAPDLKAVSNADGIWEVSYMNEEEVWWSLTRSRRTDLGNRFEVDFVFEGLEVEGPAWDEDARIWSWVVGVGSLARRVRDVGFIVWLVDIMV